MRKVVVTGFGVVTPVGNNSNQFAEAMFAMKSGAGQITRFDASLLPTTIAAEVKNFSSDFRDVKISYALAASMEAMEMAGLPGDLLSLSCRAGLSVGIGLELFDMDDLVAVKSQAHKLGVEQQELTFLNTPSDICTHLISSRHQFNQKPSIHITACAAGSDAIGHGLLEIQ